MRSIPCERIYGKQSRYAKKYNVTVRQIEIIGIDRMDAMTELGREIITIMARLELEGRRRGLLKCKQEKCKQEKRKQVKKAIPDRVDRMMQLSAKLRA